MINKTVMRLRNFGRKLRARFSRIDKTTDEKNVVKKDKELRDSIIYSQESNVLYICSIKLGKLRKEFPEVDNFKTDATEVLQELLRMNGSDKKNIPLSKTKNELVLLKKLEDSPSTDDKDKITSEFSHIIEKYKHLLHYILDLESLKKDNSYVYSLIKDSSIFDKIDLTKYGKNVPASNAKTEILVENENPGVYWAIKNTDVLEPYYNEEGKKQLVEKKLEYEYKQPKLKEKQNEIVDNFDWAL